MTAAAAAGSPSLETPSLPHKDGRGGLTRTVAVASTASSLSAGGHSRSSEKRAGAQGGCVVCVCARARYGDVVCKCESEREEEMEGARERVGEWESGRR